MTHEIVSVDVEAKRATVVCTCGKEFVHRHEDAARSRHFTHARIEASREALKGGRS